MSDIKFKATVDSKKGEVSLKNLDKGVDKVGKSTKRAAGGFKSLAVGVAAGVAAFAMASKALRGLVQWMGDAVDKAAIQQTAENEVAAALESTGREVEANTEHFKNYASELQNATTYGDEQILSAQALMIQLTDLNKEGLDAATKGAIGLASVYKTDLQAATTLVGKALAGNYGALSRYGIMVERTATDEEKRASVLEQLQTMYQRAEADTDTYAGAVKQLSNMYGDLKEEVGKAVTENEDFRDTLKTITELIKDLIDSGLVEWLTDVATEAVLSMPMLQSLAYSLGAILLIYKIQAEKKKKLDEITVEWIGHLQQEDDLQRSLREQIAAVIEVTEEDTEAKEANIEASTRLADYWQRMAEIDLAANIKEAVDELDNMTEMGTELALAWEQDMVGMEEKTETFISDLIVSLGGWAEGYEETTERIKTANELLMESWGLTTEAQLEFTQTALSEFVAMEASLKGFVGAILNTFEKWAIGQIIPKIMAALPFPINLLATGGAILAIKAIFKEIKGMEKGGWVGLQGPEIIKVGERGPEYVTKTSDIRNVYNQREGNRAVYNLYITTTREVNAEQLLRDIKEEERKHG